MNVRFISIAAATAMAASAHAAEPAKPSPQPAPQAQQRPDVVLASADRLQAPAAPSDQQVTTPRPHRVARVTTCRCGDQQAEPDGQN